jgi:hypothetical protein
MSCDPFIAQNEYCYGRWDSDGNVVAEVGVVMVVDDGRTEELD